MKYLLIVGVLMTSWTVQAQDRSIRFEEGSYQEVLAKAKKENKLLFIDCYTSWCGPCRMLAPVFEEVSDKFDDKAVFVQRTFHFIESGLRERGRAPVEGTFRGVELSDIVVYRW